MNRATIGLLFLALQPGRPVAAQCPDGTPPPCRAQPARATPAPPPNSVAVLYFDNLSPDSADAYLAEGLTEELIARLGQIERLAVASRTAVRRYRGRSLDDPATLGRALGVAYLVNGSVRRSASRLRVTVELVRASTGLRVWGDQYDRTDADLLAIQEEIAGAVATPLAGRLLPPEQVSLAARPTRNPQAYDHYLKGNYLMAQRNPGAVQRAIAEYETALRLDPRFPQALAGVAWGYVVYYDWGWTYEGVPRESLLARGFAAADRAIREDSASAEAWRVRGLLLMHRHPGTFDGAAAAIQRSLALDSRNANAFNTYGVLLEWLGDDSHAAAAHRRALAIDPGRGISLSHLADLSYRARRYEEARGLLDSTIAAEPGLFKAYAMRALVHLRLGEVAEAQRDAETAVQISTGDRFWAPAALAVVAARQGDTLSAWSQVGRLLQAIDSGGVPAPDPGYAVGTALVAVGDSVRALDLLERVRPRGGALWSWLTMPDFDAIRAHPRFQRLLEESRPPGAPR